MAIEIRKHRMVLTPWKMDTDEDLRETILGIIKNARTTEENRVIFCRLK